MSTNCLISSRSWICKLPDSNPLLMPQGRGKKPQAGFSIFRICDDKYDKNLSTTNPRRLSKVIGGPKMIESLGRESRDRYVLLNVKSEQLAMFYRYVYRHRTRLFQFWHVFKFFYRNVNNPSYDIFQSDIFKFKPKLDRNLDQSRSILEFLKDLRTNIWF